MKSRSIFAVAASLGIVLSACTSGGASPSAAAPSAPAVTAAAPSAGSTAPSASGGPSSNLPTSIGGGEGELDIIVWAGYAEDGSNVKEYDWVNPFIAANPDCAKVNVKPADTLEGRILFDVAPKSYKLRLDDGSISGRMAMVEMPLQFEMGKSIALKTGTTRNDNCSDKWRRHHRLFRRH